MQISLEPRQYSWTITIELEKRPGNIPPNKKDQVYAIPIQNMLIQAGFTLKPLPMDYYNPVVRQFIASHTDPGAVTMLCLREDTSRLSIVDRNLGD